MQLWGTLRMKNPDGFAFCVLVHGNPELGWQGRPLPGLSLGMIISQVFCTDRPGRYSVGNNHPLVGLE